MDKIKKAVEWIKKHDLYPEPPVVSSPHAPEVVANQKKVLMFATNNYLDMMHDKRVVDAAVRGVRKWGIGNGSARLLTGNIEIHQKLERAIADFKKRESGLTFVAGYMANLGAIPAIVNVLKPSVLATIRGRVEKDKDSIIFSDEYNHASIIAGVKLSGAPKEIYRHLDVKDLENRLKKYSKNTRKIIVTDGVFSMDGSIAPLPDLVHLAKKYKSILYVDDAHGTGILGKHGRGIEDYFNLEGSVDVLMGTFTKAFGGVGGFIVGSESLIDYLKITSATFIFTAPIAPPVVYGLIKSIEIVKKETWRRENVVKNAEYLREKLRRVGIDIGLSETQIIPIMIGDEKKALKASDLLFERGIFIPAARWPAVPKKSARLRVTVSSSHTQSQLDILVESLSGIKKELKF